MDRGGAGVADLGCFMFIEGKHVAVLTAYRRVIWDAWCGIRTQPGRDGYRYPDLLEGLVPTNVKNLFIFGLGQPRYGAGPLLTAGAEAIASLLKAQAKVRPLVAALSCCMAAIFVRWLGPDGSRQWALR